MAAPLWKSWRRLAGSGEAMSKLSRRPVAGGARLGIETLERREMLSVAPLHWTAGPTLPTPRAQAAAIVDYYGQIRLFGGVSTGDVTAVVNLSSASTAWSTSYPLDFGRLGAGVGPQSNGQILVFGGRKVSGTVVDEALHYDPYLGESEDAATMNSTRYLMASATDDQGNVFAIGGLDSAGAGGHVLSSVEQYDLASDEWNDVAPLPSGRAAFAAVADGEGHFFTFGGGTTNSSTSVSSTVFMYDVAADSWTAVASMPVATRESAAVMGSNGLIYVIGGQGAGGVIDTIQTYDTATDSWTIDSQAHLPVPVRSASAATDALGRLVVMGGYDASNTALSSVWYSQRLNQPDTVPTITSALPSQLPQYRPVVDAPFTFQVTGTGNPLPDFSLDAAPAGMTIDGPTGLIHWTPAAGQDGLQNVIVRASNFAGATTQSFTLNVYATPPDLTVPTAPNGLVASNITPSTATLTWNPSTDNVAVAGYNVYEVRTTTSRWHRHTYYTLVASNLTDTTFTLTNLKPQSYHRYVTKAVDTSGNLSAYSSLLALTTTSLPTLTYYNYYGATPTVTADHPLTLSLYVAGNPKPTVSLVSGPTGMSVTEAGLVTWTPTGGDVGDVPVTFRATNSVGSTDLSLTIVVQSNLPVLTANPIFNGTRYVAPFAIADQAFVLQLAENATGTAVTYSIDSGPAGMTVAPDTGLVNWSPGASDVGTQTIVFRATNYAGSTTLTVVLPVYAAGTDKTPPSAVTGITLTFGTPGTATVSWTAATDDVGVAGYNITLRYGYVGRGRRYKYIHFTAPADATSMVLTGLPTSAYRGVFITAFDAAGNVGA